MYLSEHFQDKEFCCHCCGELKVIDPKLLAGLEKLRAMINRPIHINSGYRCEKHNQRIGGASKSYHLKGMAADISVKGMDSQELFSYCETINEFHGLGCYRSWVHVDTREKMTVWKKK
jgi:uncharacterized protein YcbK (DUF882 family)